ncbi:MAG TPA: hypothetical protein VFC63_01130 [Blastocatellia bacterium]|nr:hypothetical protein [Blastocatellia bacterium]
MSTEYRGAAKIVSVIGDLLLVIGIGAGAIAVLYGFTQSIMLYVSAGIVVFIQGIFTYGLFVGIAEIIHLLRKSIDKAEKETI